MARKRANVQKKESANKGSTEAVDDTNALVLPGTKEKKAPKEEKSNTRLLSKKKRKALQKVLERKQKKDQRKHLLEELSKFQASSEELSQYLSVTAAQTLGKKYDVKSAEINGGTQDANVRKKRPYIDSITLVKRKHKGPLKNDNKRGKYDPNVVGFESEDSTSSEGESETEEENDKNEKSNKLEEVIEVKPVENLKPDGVKSQNEVNGKMEVSVQENIIKEKDPPIPSVFVPVHRSPSVQEQRLQLPILAEEQVIMETLKENSVLILAGETGCGKTTQMPQFLYEAGYATNGQLIGVTEPRRVAAVSMCHRVAEEMALSGGEVSYQIRFEGNVTEKTQVKFMTDGILIKEIQKDFLLSHYSVIILDEAHERNVNTDILLGLLSRIVPLRNKKGNSLKLIIMSATLRVQDFLENKRLFKVEPPLITITSRQFPVTIHFNKHTPSDYVAEAYAKVCKIHRQLPDGGILVFLTGMQEVHQLVSKLRRSFPFSKKKKQPHEHQPTTSTTTDDDDDARLCGLNESEREMERALRAMQGIRKKVKGEGGKRMPAVVSLDDYSLHPRDDTEGDFLDDIDEVLSDPEEEEALQMATSAQPLWVLPLFALLPSKKQQQVFQPPPPDTRLCIVATNVAETSLTIPNIKYVIDSGKVKMKLYDQATGVSMFSVVNTSKASADQRAGRAGRVAPGHCYRLYSSALYNDEFPSFLPPEMQRRPVDDLVLQMKVMGIQKVINFPFPSPPEYEQLKAAEQRLILLGALEDIPMGMRLKQAKSRELSTSFTPLGRSMAAFPVCPRLSKMLALSHQHDLLPLTICLVAALSVPQVLEERNTMAEEGVTSTGGGGQGGKWVERRRAWAGHGQMKMLGDAMVLLRAVCAAEVMSCSPEFCAANGLRHRAIVEIHKLRVQLTSEVNMVLGKQLSVDPNMPVPSQTQCRLLRQLLLSAFPDQIAHKETEEEKPGSKKKRPVYRCMNLSDPVYLHSTSIFFNSPPDWVIFQEVYETKRLFMRGVTAIQPEWMATFASSLCTFSEPLEEPTPRYDKKNGVVMCYRNVTFGKGSWQLPAMELEYPDGLNKFRWFARFFLEGLVCKKLNKYKNVMLSVPATMIKSWAKLQPRTETLLRALTSENVSSKVKLLEAWSQDQTYLRNEYLQWIPESLQMEVQLLWPPV